MIVRAAFVCAAAEAQSPPRAAATASHSCAASRRGCADGNSWLARWIAGRLAGAPRPGGAGGWRTPWLFALAYYGLLLVFDGRYRDFPLGLFALPCVGHALAGTPHIAAAIAPSVIVGGIFDFAYAGRLLRIATRCADVGRRTRNGRDITAWGRRLATLEGRT